MNKACIKEAVSSVQRYFKEFMSLDHQQKQRDAEVLRDNLSYSVSDHIIKLRLVDNSSSSYSNMSLQVRQKISVISFQTEDIKTLICWAYLKAFPFDLRDGSLGELVTVDLTKDADG